MSVYSVAQPQQQVESVYEIIPCDYPTDTKVKPQTDQSYEEVSPINLNEKPKPPVAQKPSKQLQDEVHKELENKVGSVSLRTEHQHPPDRPSRASTQSSHVHNVPIRESIAVSKGSVNDSLRSSDIAKFSIADLGEWMVKLKLGKYTAAFSAQMIDGALSQELDIDILQKEFGMKKIEAIRMHKFVNEGHFPK